MPFPSLFPRFLRTIQAICLALLVWSGDSRAQWVQSGPTQGKYVNCFASRGGKLFAGTDGGVLVSADSGLSWLPVNNGLTDTIVEAITASDTNLFCATLGGGVFLSSNGGGIWIPANNGLPNARVSSLGASGTNLFAGTWGATFVSTNSGGNWSEITTGLTQFFVFSYASIGTNLFAGTWNGVFLSPDSGKNWTHASNGLANPWVFSLAAAGPNLFAGTYGGVYLSTDNGGSWAPVNSGLSNLSVYALAASGTSLFAGTYGGGVFLSTNSGTNWIQVNTGLGNLSVKALVFIGGNLIAGTYFGGAWKTTVSDLYASLTTFTVNNGWNLVSVPREPPDPGTSALFPGVSPGTVYRYAGGNFRQATTMLTGEGYWALYDSAGTNTISGTPTGNVSLTVSTGNRWVLIGSVTTSVPATALTSNPPGAIVPGTLLAWNGSAYVQPTAIEPGRGYWVFVNAPCTLTISQPGTRPARGIGTREARIAR